MKKLAVVLAMLAFSTAAFGATPKDYAECFTAHFYLHDEANSAEVLRVALLAGVKKEQLISLGNSYLLEIMTAKGPALKPLAERGARACLNVRAESGVKTWM